MKIVIIEQLGISQEELENTKSYFESFGHELKYYMGRDENPQTIIERAFDADVLVISNIKLTSEVIEACKNLKLINVAFTGYDHIDLIACKKKGISVCNCAGYSTTAVSELAVGMAISLQRNIVRMEAQTRKLGTRNNYLGTELFGKTVGIIGTGEIGLATASLFKAFGCKILAFSRTTKDLEFIEYVSIDELMKSSDIISLHIPSNSETEHFINESKLKLMKPTAVIINTARGKIIDTESLSEMLDQNKIGGAAIDVYEMEPPLPIDYTLLRNEKIILLPHIAYATKESMVRRFEIVKSNLESYLKGNLENRVF